MSYCSNCGANLPENAKFCHVCGAKVPESNGDNIKVEDAIEVNTQPIISNLDDGNIKVQYSNTSINCDDAKFEKSRKINKIGTIIGIAVIAIAVVLGLGTVLSLPFLPSENDETTVEPTAEELALEEKNAKINDFITATVDFVRFMQHDDYIGYLNNKDSLYGSNELYKKYTNEEEYVNATVSEYNDYISEIFAYNGDFSQCIENHFSTLGENDISDIDYIFLTAYMYYLYINDALDNEADAYQSIANAVNMYEEYKKYGDCLYCSAETLVNDLNSNAFNAKETYLDRYVCVTGKISNIDASGKYIDIDPVNAGFNWTMIQCYIDTDEVRNAIRQMKVGDNITLKGIVTSVGEVLGYSIDIVSVE